MNATNTLPQTGSPGARKAGGITTSITAVSTSSASPPAEVVPASYSAPHLNHGSHNVSPVYGSPQASFSPSSTFHDFRDPDELSSSYTSSVYSDNTGNLPAEPSVGMYGSGSFAQDALEVNNQLNALFSTELFDKFFRDALDDGTGKPVDGSGGLGDVKDVLAVDNAQFPFPTDSTEAQPFMASMPPTDLDLFALPNTFMAGANISPTSAASAAPPPGYAALPAVAPPPVTKPPVEPAVAPYPSEYQQYSTCCLFPHHVHRLTSLTCLVHLFYNMFLAQMPIMHIPTFTVDGKPEILISAMQACGALYVKTQAAVRFIDATLASARDRLVGEFVRRTVMSDRKWRLTIWLLQAKAPTSWEDQVHLILAVVLLQTIGLFHQRPEQRAHSSIYHGMLVMVRPLSPRQRRSRWLTVPTR